MAARGLLHLSDVNTAELLERYNRPTPRYTSYPPAPHWRGADAGLLLSAIGKSSAPLSIYVHIPFCEKLCLYCGCNVVISKNREVASPYVDRLIAEMDLLKPAHGRVVTQIHWGGGTPTYLDVSLIRRLYDGIASRFRISPAAEISIEIDPRVTTKEHLQALRALGFNRLSMGIQDFDDEVQKTVRRIQPFKQTQDLFEEARALGFDGVNADLIYGLPRQTRASFKATLEKVILLAPDRLSVFSYAHVPTLKRQQRSFEKHLPPELNKLRLFEDAVECLTGAGYEFIGIDHFARSGDSLVTARDSGTLHRNFQGYTTHAETDLLGFGVSAISAVAGVFAQNQRDLQAWSDCVDAGRIPVFRGYERTEDDALRGSVIESWLCSGRILKDEVERLFPIRFDEYFADELKALKQFETDGLLVGLESRVISSTQQGRIFMRAAARVFDAFQSAAIAARTV